jgi:hypothetical protein
VSWTLLVLTESPAGVGLVKTARLKARDETMVFGNIAVGFIAFTLLS